MENRGNPIPMKAVIDPPQGTPVYAFSYAAADRVTRGMTVAHFNSVFCLLG